MIKNLFLRSAWLFSGLLVSRVVSTVIFIVLARQMLPALFGQATYYLTIISLVTLIADFGLNQWYQKQSTLDNQKKLLKDLISARLVTLFFSLGLTLIVLFTFKIFNLYTSIILLLTLIPEAFQSAFDGYYLVQKQVFKISTKVTVKLVVFAALTYLFHQWTNFNFLILAFLLSSTLATIWYLPKAVYQNLNLNFSVGLSTLKASSRYALLILTSFAYARGDALIIQNTIGSGFLGLYSVAYRYLENIALLPSALAQNLFHISAQTNAISAKQLAKITLMMSGLGLLVAVIMFMAAPFLTVTLLGPAYAPSTMIVQILSLVVVLFFINSPLSTIVQSSDLMLKFLPWGAGNTALNILLNLILIPWFGITAAATVMAITEVTGLLINCYFVQKVYQTA